MVHLLQLHGEDLCEEGNFQLFDLLTLCLQRNGIDGEDFLRVLRNQLKTMDDWHGIVTFVELNQKKNSWIVEEVEEN